LAGFGGWLILLGIVLAIVSPVSFVLLCNTELASLDEIPSLRQFVGTELVIAGLRTALGVVAGLFLWRVWPKAVLLARIYFVFAIAIGWIMAFALPNLAPSDAGVAGSRSILVQNALWTTLIDAIWLGYLARSRRVRDTYSG
jgi:hypothetical protein